MRVLHVIGSIRRQGGGPSRSSQGLVAGLRVAGVDATLMSLCHGELPWICGADHFVNGGDFEDALDEINPDIVHIHGIWQRNLHRCVVTCRKRGVPYVVAPRGMLEPWSLRQKWLKKRIARFLYQDRDLKFAAALHATAMSEADQFRHLGFRNECIVSPNGVNVPAVMPKRTSGNDKRRALFMSRMHAKKGVLELVESWGRVRPLGWSCELVYTVGCDEERAYEACVKSRVQELGLSDCFVFTGPLDDDKKWDAYGRADLFVLPTYSENFGIVVAEALWAGVPVITTKGTPWSKLVDRDCGWWVELPPKGSLDIALREATHCPVDELRRKGARGRSLVSESYTWGAVCKSVVRGYRRILESHGK